MKNHKKSGLQSISLSLQERLQQHIQKVADRARDTTFTGIDIGKVVTHTMEIVSSFAPFAMATSIPADSFTSQNSLTIWAMVESSIRLWHAVHHAITGIKKLHWIGVGTWFLTKNLSIWITKYCCWYIEHRSKSTREKM